MLSSPPGLSHGPSLVRLSAQGIGASICLKGVQQSLPAYTGNGKLLHVDSQGGQIEDHKAVRPNSITRFVRQHVVQPERLDVPVIDKRVGPTPFEPATCGNRPL